MKQSRTRLAHLIADAVLKRRASRRFSEEVAAYLLSEGRASELESVLRDVQADWAEAGFLEVLAYSAFPLNAELKKEIITQVRDLYPSAKQISITEVPTPEVIGGVRLMLPNQQLDLTIEAKLDKLKQLTSAGKEV